MASIFGGSPVGGWDLGLIFGSLLHILPVESCGRCTIPGALGRVIEGRFLPALLKKITVPDAWRKSVWRTPKKFIELGRLTR
jgi:hypothetical protein